MHAISVAMPKDKQSHSSRAAKKDANATCAHYSGVNRKILAGSTETLFAIICCLKLQRLCTSILLMLTKSRRESRSSLNSVRFYHFAPISCIDINCPFPTPIIILSVVLTDPHVVGVASLSPTAPALTLRRLPGYRSHRH